MTAIDEAVAKLAPMGARRLWEADKAAEILRDLQHRSDSQFDAKVRKEVERHLNSGRVVETGRVEGLLGFLLHVLTVPQLEALCRLSAAPITDHRDLHVSAARDLVKVIQEADPERATAEIQQRRHQMRTKAPTVATGSDSVAGFIAGVVVGGALL